MTLLESMSLPFAAIAEYNNIVILFVISKASLD